VESNLKDFYVQIAILLNLLQLFNMDDELTLDKDVEKIYKELDIDYVQVE